jgi:hypothetical protein
MTKIIETAKTYELRDGEMVHDGFFVISDNYRMKWSSVWQWRHITALPSFNLRIDHLLHSLRDAS